VSFVLYMEENRTLREQKALRKSCRWQVFQLFGAQSGTKSHRLWVDKQRKFAEQIFHSSSPPRRGKPFGLPHFFITASLYRLPLLFRKKHRFANNFLRLALCHQASFLYNEGESNSERAKSVKKKLPVAGFSAFWCAVRSASNVRICETKLCPILHPIFSSRFIDYRTIICYNFIIDANIIGTGVLPVLFLTSMKGFEYFEH